MPEPYLHVLRPDDALAVLAAFRSDPEMRRQGDVTDDASAGAYVTNLLDPARSHRPWVIARPDDTLAGLVVVTVDDENRSGWFWYWLHADDRGQGWVSRAATAVANWALTDAGLHRLELGHRVNNPASGAVARAAGSCRRASSGRSSSWTAGGSTCSPTDGSNRTQSRSAVRQSSSWTVASATTTVARAGDDDTDVE